MYTGDVVDVNVTSLQLLPQRRAQRLRRYPGAVCNRRGFGVGLCGAWGGHGCIGFWPVRGCEGARCLPEDQWPEQIGHWSRLGGTAGLLGCRE